jgi:hypothetical protein
MLPAANLKKGGVVHCLALLRCVGFGRTKANFLIVQFNDVHASTTAHIREGITVSSYFGLPRKKKAGARAKKLTNFFGQLFRSRSSLFFEGVQNYWKPS